MRVQTLRPLSHTDVLGPCIKLASQLAFFVTADTLTMVTNQRQSLLWGKSNLNKINGHFVLGRRGILYKI